MPLTQKTNITFSSWRLPLAIACFLGAIIGFVLVFLFWFLYEDSAVTLISRGFFHLLTAVLFYCYARISYTEDRLGATLCFLSTIIWLACFLIFTVKGTMMFL